MIELKKNGLVFRFPEVHQHAALALDFQRTLRIPDDGKDYPLPAGLGRFPLKLVDEFASRVPEKWMEHGGIVLPMYQSEAMWINFSHGTTGYPFVVKIAAGKIDAITGGEWTDTFARGPQNYLVVPEQPWLDGFCVEEGIIRQFVAMPLGSGYSAEEQLRGAAEHGGIQIVASPMKREAYERMYLRMRRMVGRSRECGVMEMSRAGASMGLAPGGRMRQKICEDRHDFSVWDFEHSSRCFVHLSNSLMWRAVTGDEPPTVPLTGKEYTAAGIPWFEHYAEGSKALGGSKVLAKLQSIFQLAKQKGDVPLPENDPIPAEKVVALRDGLQPGQVREGRF